LLITGLLTTFKYAGKSVMRGVRLSAG